MPTVKNEEREILKPLLGTGLGGLYKEKVSEMINNYLDKEMFEGILITIYKKL